MSISIQLSTLNSLNNYGRIFVILTFPQYSQYYYNTSSLLNKELLYVIHCVSAKILVILHTIKTVLRGVAK